MNRENQNGLYKKRVVDSERTIDPDERLSCRPPFLADFDSGGFIRIPNVIGDKSITGINTVDIDGDGDFDIAPRSANGSISWFEWRDESLVQHDFETTLKGTRIISAIDFDRDKDVDPFNRVWLDHVIREWPN